MLDTALRWLEDSSWAVAIRQSTWIYPALEIVHITGIVVLVGPALMFDLRLLGFAKKLPIATLGDHLLQWSRRGLILVVPSGLMLFISNASTLGYDPVFWLKMLLLLVAGLNALVFHRFTFRVKNSSNEIMAISTGSKLAAIISIIVWLSVITCGRLLAY